MKAQNPVYFADTRYLADARRFDMGERDHFISMEMAATGMEMIANWGAGAVVARLSTLTRRISYHRTSTNVLRPDDRFRAPHILFSALPNSALGDAITKLAHEQIYVAPRLGISPHVYDDEADVARFVTTVTRATA